MNEKPKHVEWLVDTGERLTTADGRTVEVWELRHQPDAAVLSAWAKHFREHYCLDSDLDELCYPDSHKDFLLKKILPDKNKGWGPSVRAGDFGEILVADLFEYKFGYWVPRIRWVDKPKRNQSSQGSDMLGFKISNDYEDSPDDEITVCEAKTQFSGKDIEPKLQEAIDHSMKDEIRMGESLVWLKRRTLQLAPEEKKKLFQQRIERFQSPVDRPHKTTYNAAALFSIDIFNPNHIAITDASAHPHASSLRLIIIRGEMMMKVVHELYSRAADEA